MKQVISDQNNIYKINLDKFLESYYITSKEIEKLSNAKIQIEDLPGNLMYTGEDLIIIDTLEYHYVDYNPININFQRFNYSIANSLYEMLKYCSFVTEEQLNKLSNSKTVDQYVKGVSKILKK